MTDEDRKIAWLHDQIRACQFPANDSKATEVLSLLGRLVEGHSMFFGMVLSIDNETRAGMIAMCRDMLQEWYRFHDGDAVQVQIWNGAKRLGVELGMEPPPSVVAEERERRRIDEALAALPSPRQALEATVAGVWAAVERLGRSDLLADEWRAIPRVATPWFAPLFGESWMVWGALLDPELVKRGHTVIVRFVPEEKKQVMMIQRPRAWAHFELGAPIGFEPASEVMEGVLADYEFLRNGRACVPPRFDGMAVHPYAAACLAARNLIV